MELMYIDKSPRRFQSFPVHRHDCWEITLNLSGRGTATVDGKEYPFGEGTIFCVAPGIPHGKVAPDGFVEGNLMLRDFVPFGSSGFYRLEDDSNGTFRYLFDLIFDVVMKDSPNAQAIIHSLVDVLYQMLVGWSLTGNRSLAVDRFQKVLLDNLSNCDFDIAEGMRQTGYSASYFRKLFKRSTGRSPLDYLNQLRIEYAKRQIQQYFGVRSLKEIALHSGFADPYYFSRVFRQYTGANPTRYGEEMARARVQKIERAG
jgi:AraC-like DNA-binding protein